MARKKTMEIIGNDGKKKKVNIRQYANNGVLATVKIKKERVAQSQ